MVYKTEAKVEREFQVFSYLEPEYKLDKSSGKLVQIGEIDTFKQIQSHKDCALDVILDKFLGVPLLGVQRVPLGAEDEVFNHAQARRDPLEEMGELTQTGEALRAKYGLSDSLSLSEVFAFVAQMKKQADELVANKSKKSEVSNETPQTDSQTE